MPGINPHTTMLAFGYPETLIREYGHWTVQLRPRQATLGALVLICKEDVTAFSAIGDDAFAELRHAVRDIEMALAKLFAFDKINYLMLMMVDPHVHFHVLPRYNREREFEGVMYRDATWPGPPDLGAALEIDTSGRGRLLEALHAAWPGS